MRSTSTGYSAMLDFSVSNYIVLYDLNGAKYELIFGHNTISNLYAILL